MQANGLCPNYQARQILIIGLFCCLLFMLSSSDGHGEEIGVDASWRFSSSHPGGPSADITTFNQRYGLQWNPRVTRAILLNTAVNYSKNVSTGNNIRQTLSPTGSFQVENDLFFAELSGLVNQSSNSRSRDQLTRSWEGVLASSWDYQYWPSLSLTMGQSWLNDSLTPPLTDTQRRWSEYSLKWDSGAFSSYYSYSSQLRDDAVANNSYDEKRHFGRLDYQNTFFSKGLSVNLSGQLTDSTTDFTSRAVTVAPVAIRVEVSQAMSGIDGTPLSGALPLSPSLIDGDRDAVGLSIGFHQVRNIGIKPDLQEVDTIFLYTGVLTSLQINEAAQLRFSLYSSEDGLSWHLEQDRSTSSYDPNRFRYQIAVGGIARVYLKLVVKDWPPSFSVPITEIESSRNLRASGTRESTLTENQQNTRTLMDMGLRYTLNNKTSLNYNLVWDNSVSSNTNDRTRIFQSGTIKWQYSPYFSPSFAINNTATSNSVLTDTSQRSYAINVLSSILPTLETTFGVTRNENFSDGQPQSSNDAFHLNVNAALYPKLDSTLEIGTNFTSNDQNNSENGNLALRWTLTARLRPSLLVDFIAESASTGASLSELLQLSDSSGQTTLNINWRPSELVSVQLNGSKPYGASGTDSGSGDYLLDTNFTLIRTSKTSVIVGYKASLTESDTLQSLNSNWSWNLSEFFTMQSIANYIIGQQENSWLINARLSTKF